MKNKKGFTLLELLVVVIIIGILAAIALPQYNKAVWKSKFVQTKILAGNIVNAEEVYFAAHGQYTSNFDNLDIDISPNSYSNTKDAAYFDWGGCLLIASEDRNEVHCTIYKNTKRYLMLVLEFYNGTYFMKVDAYASKRICIAFGEDDIAKPTPTEISYKTCLEETGNNNPRQFGGTSLAFGYK